MKQLGLLMGVLALGLPVAARAQADSAQPAPGITLAALVGIWKGGPADKRGRALPDQEASMVLSMWPDSTYTWAGLGVPPCMAKPNSRWKRLTSTNISWCGGPGYDLKLDGKKLTMTLAQAGGDKQGYFVFRQIDTQPAEKVASSDTVYTPNDIDEPVRVIAIPTPRYPAALRKSRIEGLVDLRYIVDATGHAEPNSFQILYQTHLEFINPAEEAILKGVFKPAKFRGHAVRQLVQQRVMFQTR